MDRIPLKRLLKPQNKVLMILILAGIFMAIYSTAGAISIQQADNLPIPKFEADIPFMPWTIWIYIVLYPIYLIWILGSYKDYDQFNKTLYGFIMLTVICALCFILFPISYPRGFFPLPLEDSFTIRIFSAMRSVDTPSNCIPSLHVGLCFLFAWSMKDENKSKFWISIFLSILISLSTLTTKQHYIYDLVAGFLLSTGIYFFFKKYTTIKD